MRPAKTCTRCHEARPTSDFHRRAASSDGLASICKPCALAKRRAYRENNQEKVRAYNAEWRKRNPQYSARTAKEWREEHPERHRDYGRQWAIHNADRLAAAKRAWYEANRDRMVELRRNDPRRPERERRDRERYREQRAEAQRVRRMVTEATPIPLEDLDGLWTGRCGICSDEMSRDARWPDPWSPSVDHIMPISRGGPHVIENLQWAHLRCNVSKGARVDEGGERHRSAA